MDSKFIVDNKNLSQEKAEEIMKKFVEQAESGKIVWATIHCRNCGSSWGTPLNMGGGINPIFDDLCNECKNTIS